MNSDSSIITGLRMAERVTASEYSKAFAELAQSSCAQTIRTLLDGHLAIAQKLAQLDGLYKNSSSEEEFAESKEVSAFVRTQENADKAAKGY